jgi:hypothetical protein
MDVNGQLQNLTLTALDICHRGGKLGITVFSKLLAIRQ